MGNENSTFRNFLSISLIMSSILLFSSSCNSGGGNPGEDLFGVKTSPDVNINLLAVTPSVKSLKVNEVYQFEASGGTQPYTFSLDSGIGTVTSTGFYTAPGVAGIAAIRVADREGKVAFATITISDVLNLSPSSVTLGQSAVQTFNTNGGVPPYTYSIVLGSGGIVAATGVFTSPVTSGNTIVKVEDSVANTAFATIKTNQTLQFSPTTITVGIGESINYSTSGGALPYSYSILTGGGSINSSGVYTAPMTPQSATVRATDNGGNVSDSIVTIVDKPQITPENSYLATNGSLAFNVTGGTPPYTYSMVSGGGSIDAATGVYTSGTNIETVIIQIQDNDGYTDQTSINIFRPAELALGLYHSCVTTFSSDTTSSTKCFGAKATSYNDRGMLGSAPPNYFLGDSSDELGDNLPTVNLGTSVEALGVEVGYEFTCAVMTDYRVKCFGANYYGALHNGSSNSNHKGYSAGQMGDNLAYLNLGTGRTVKSGGDWRDYFSIFYRSGCAILDNDELRCWGYNGYGQLGLGDTNSRGDAIGEVGDSTPNINLGGDIPLQVQTSTYHTCVLLTGGDVKCWGEASRGQLGQGNETDLGKTAGTTPNNISSIDLGTGKTAIKITTGADFSCALLNDNTVKCWGYNNYGQLGRGTTNNEAGDGPGEMGDSMVAVDLGIGKTVIDISSGHGHTCAILNDNTVKCWGRNDQGQLGIGNTTHKGRYVTDLGDNLIPVDLGTGRTATDIWAKYLSTCAKLDNGAVKCWGENYRGQLALGHRFDVGKSALSLGDNLAPLNLSTTETANHITFSAAHACGVLSDNTLKCWGEDQWGMRGGEDWFVGDESTDMGSNLLEVNLGTNIHAKEIKSFMWSTCALTFDDTLKCWGPGNEGAMGQGSANDLGILATEMGDNLDPLNFGTGRTVKGFAVGYHNGCAILDNDDLKCWGRADSGFLGSGNQIDRGDHGGEMGDNLAVVNLGTNLTARSVSAGDRVACAVIEDATDTHDGKVKCWGYNNYGQLGQGNTSSRGDGGGEMGDSLAFTDLGTGRTATKTCNGSDFACALMDNSQVKCWGRGNYIGQGSTAHLGNGGGEMGDNLPELSFGAGRTVKDIACGRYHTCVILDNGKLKCFGSGGNGRTGLGNGYTIGDGANEMGDFLSYVDLGTGRTAVKIEAGSAHTCAVLDNSSVKCWGYNIYGQLGAGHLIDLGASPLHMGDNLKAVDLE